MKKSKKTKSSSNKSTLPDVELPTIVTGMAKLVERLEILEGKMDQVLGRVSNLPSEIRSAVQSSRPQPPHSQQSFQPRSEHYSQGSENNRSERRMFQAICADCHKNCEVPFKPGDRPIYCKECFAIRKAGHKPQDPDRRIPQDLQKKPSYVPSALSSQAIPTLTGNVTVFTKEKKKSASRGAKAKKKKR